MKVVCVKISFAVPAFFILAVGGCRTPSAGESDAGLWENEAENTRDANIFRGIIEPVNATKLFAPRNEYKLGWTRRVSANTKLTELAEDGQKIEEGEVVAKFEFQGERIRRQVDEGLDVATAQLQRKAVELQSQKRQLLSEKRLKSIEAQKAEVDIRKGNAVSARDLKRYQLLYEKAEFEQKASAERFEAYREHLRAEKRFYQIEKRKAENDLNRYLAIERRYVVKAPHAGVVRHAFIPSRRRKVEINDYLRAGMHFISVAKDESVRVRFFVPESSLGKLKTDMPVMVESLSRDVAYEARVSKILPFPQELGFVLDDLNMPGAREKVYVALASFEEVIDNLAAGLEVKVRVE